MHTCMICELPNIPQSFLIKMKNGGTVCVKCLNTCNEVLHQEGLKVKNAELVKSKAKKLAQTGTK